MRTKLHKVMFSALLAASVAVMMPTAAHAARGVPGSGYVPPPTYGQNPDTEPLENPYEPVAPTEVPVDLPGVTDPGAGLAGGGDPLAEAPNVAPTTDSDVLGGSNTPPVVESPSGEGVFGGVLSRTGAETMPLARAGLAALTLGAGMVMLGRRRRQVQPAA